MEQPLWVSSRLSGVVGPGLGSFGRLTIANGAVSFSPEEGMNRWMTAEEWHDPVIHVKKTMIVLVARLVPPNLNSALILEGDPERGAGLIASVRMPSWDRRAAVAALGGAGFEPRRLRTWFSLGGDISSEMELHGFLRRHGVDPSNS